MNVLNSFVTHLFILICFDVSNNVFIFNILHGDKQSETYYYFTTKQIDKIAKSLNVKKVKIKDDYMENDITVGFFK